MTVDQWTRWNQEPRTAKLLTVPTKQTVLLSWDGYEHTPSTGIVKPYFALV